MQIVIDIDKKRFRDIQRISTVQLKRRTPTLEQVIANGTPLPKGHGILIDARAFSGDIFVDTDLTDAHTCYNSIRELLENAPTIIEADKEE